MSEDLSHLQGKIDLFSKLFRDLEAEIGTRDLADLVLRALMKSIKGFKGDKVKEFCRQFRELRDVISNTEPKFGVLNYHFAEMALEFQKDLSGLKCGCEGWKYKAVKKIGKILQVARAHKAEILHNAVSLAVEGKTILIHDHSHTVQDVLTSLHRAGQHFTVVIAEQDLEKSQSNIESMHAAQIPFKVIPAYMLSHMHKQIDMLFFGALTFKDTMHFVMDPGTHSIISEFHLEKIPTYMFFDTAKFSLWKSKKRGEVFMKAHSKKHVSKEIMYDQVKYSHDRVPVNLFKKVVTNEGIFTPEAFKKLYKERYSKYTN